MAAIRQALGPDAGTSCCRAGGGGVWSKQSVLFLSRSAGRPLYLVKVGKGAIDDRFLQNEAQWLTALGFSNSLAAHVPKMAVHRSGADLCFLAQQAITGELSDSLGSPHFDFLRKLHDHSARRLEFRESLLRQNLLMRLSALDGKLPEEWLARLRNAMRKVDEALGGQTLLMTAAHNDFTQWNMRLQCGRACVFDWEFAAHEQMPLFDPLHFTLSRYALKGGPAGVILSQIPQALALCRRHLGPDLTAMADAQVLAYFLNLCTLYLNDDPSIIRSNNAVICYAEVIDHLLQATP